MKRTRHGSRTKHGRAVEEKKDVEENLHGTVPWWAREVAETHQFIGSVSARRVATK